MNRLLGGALIGAPLICGTLALACSHSAIQRRREADGTFRVDCQRALVHCLSAIEEVCPGGYEIVSGHEDVTVAGPRDSSEPTRTSEAVARCRTPEPLFGGRTTTPTPVEAAPAAAPAPAAPAPACFPGATQACIGAGGCRGGQVCLAGGAAFGPCDCGAAPTVTDTSAPG